MKPLRLTLLIIATQLLAWGEQHAQTPPLERTISVTAEGETLDIFLKKVGTQAGCVFSYSPSALDVNRTVSKSYIQQTMREILEDVFAGQVTLKQKDNYIILAKAPQQSKEVVVSGYVVDESSGERVKSASIYDPITLRSTTTDEYGYFQLKMKHRPEDYKLIIRTVEYNDTLRVSSSQGSTFKKFRVKVDPAVDSFTEGVSKHATNMWAWTKQSVAKINMDNVRDSIHRTWQVSLVPFVGTNRKLSGNVTNDWSFNILGGYSAGTEKAELGLLFNINTGPVKYVQMASLFNLNDGIMKGVQIAGLTNINLDSTHAFQLAGLANFSERSVRGAQLAILGNVAAKDVRGAQLAVLGNFSGKEVKGAQVAVLANVSGKQVKGAQLSMLANVAPKVHGVQVGLFNFTDSIKGVPLGLMSFVAKGYHTIEVSTDEVLPLNLSFRTGIRGFYNIITAGVRPEKSDTTTWAFGYGIGTSPQLGRKLHLNLDLTSHQLNKGNVEALNLVNRFYVGLDVQLTKALAISAGPTIGVRIYDTSFTWHPDLFWSYKPATWREKVVDANQNLAQQWWWGFRVGLRVL